MSYISRFNAENRLWELGYLVGAHFFVMSRYPNV